jgi:NAD(P)H-hydrate epimerase
MILPDSSQMRAIDRCAIDHFGIPGIVLMENAGLGTVLLIESLFGPLRRVCIPIFIGPGNNGGDGLVIARHLMQREANPVLVYLVEPGRLKGDSGINQRIIETFELPALVCTDSSSVPETLAALRELEYRLGPAGLYVDAIFGTGLCRPIDGHFLDMIGEINALSSARTIPIIAVDTPSGLDSDTGSVLGCCINAHTTATYGYAKLGQMMAPSRRYTGTLKIIDIGIPAAVADHVPVAALSIDPSVCRDRVKRLDRSPDSHKGSYGHLLVVGGSAGKTGAAILAGRGALRSGCGLISLCCPRALNVIYETSVTEAMTLPLASETTFEKDDLEAILGHADGKHGVVLGPGIGQHPSTADLVVKLYNNLELPMVVDADALNIIAAHRRLLRPPPGARILTPHPGEMARLIDRTVSEVQADRIDAARTCFERFGSSDHETVVILKGAATVIAETDRVWINTTGNPAMASGGMGDVLSGIIGSLLCQGLSPVDAAISSVFLHGYCGDLLLQSHGIGFSASELADRLGEALNDVVTAG